MAKLNTTRGVMHEAGAEGKRVAKQVAYSPLMDRLTRLGYAVKGVIYILIGILAVQGAMGKSSSPADQFGALATISRLPFGKFALVVVLVGLIAYSIWGFVRAFLDPLHKGKDTKGLLTRAGYLISGVTYASFIIPTYSLIQGKGAGSSNQTAKFVTSLMSMPAGRVLVGIIGLVVVAAGIYQIYLGITANFDQRFKPYALTPEQRKVAIQSGRIGTAARGVVFALVGFFLCIAALYARPSQAQGFKGALDFLARQPYGLWLLGTIAVGLIAFGVYSLMSAAWFRFKDTQR